jgi:hypothetical protein
VLVQEIRKMAQGMGIKPGKLSKIDLIHNIQLAEGNFDCFATAVAGDCDQFGCCWREDCFSSSKRNGKSNGRQAA